MSEPSVPKSSMTELLFLKISKLVLMMAMGLALLATVLAIVASPFYLLQSPKEPAPAEPAPQKTLDIDEFIKQLQPQPQKESKAGEAKDDAPPAETKEPKLYLAEAQKIIGCVKQSNEAAGLDARDFSEDTVEGFRRDLQRVVQMKDRGAPYVADATKMVCSILVNPVVVDIRKKNKDLRVFIPAVTFHLGKWDQMRAEAKNFEEKERRRVAREEADEETRVAAGMAQGKLLLILAASAFGIFMCLALYLILAAMESNQRRIAFALEKLRLP